jgi:hypothetical protein
LRGIRQLYADNRLVF